MFWKKKKKDTNDYLKNELLRSRMSDISLRTDEIIQQYFFVAKEDTLTLEEYLRIRELATRELGMVESTAIAIIGEKKDGKQVCLGIEDHAQTNAQIVKSEEVPMRVQQEYKGIEEPPTNPSISSHFMQGNNMRNEQEFREVEKIKPLVAEPVKAVDKATRRVKEEDIEFPFEDKNPAEARIEPVRTEKRKDDDFNFLAMLQSVED